MPDHAAQIVRLADKLARVHQLLPALAYPDRYATFPVPEAELLAFEQQWGVRLPSGYRQFRQVVGSGAGPGKGLCRLEPPDNSLTFYKSSLAIPLHAWPGRSHEEWNGPLDTLSDDEYEADAHFTGLLTLTGYRNDGVVLGLVVSGPQRRRVIELDFCWPNVPPRFSGCASFLGWYESWLDSCQRDFSPPAPPAS